MQIRGENPKGIKLQLGGIQIKGSVLVFYIKVDNKIDSFKLPIEIVDTTDEGSEDKPIIVASDSSTLQPFKNFPIAFPKLHHLQPSPILVLKGIGEIGGAASKATTLASFGFSGNNGITTVKLF